MHCGFKHLACILMVDSTRQQIHHIGSGKLQRRCTVCFELQRSTALAEFLYRTVHRKRLSAMSRRKL